LLRAADRGVIELEVARLSGRCKSLSNLSVGASVRYDFSGGRAA